MHNGGRLSGSLSIRRAASTHLSFIRRRVAGFDRAGRFSARQMFGSAGSTLPRDGFPEAGLRAEVLRVWDLWLAGATARNVGTVNCSGPATLAS